MTEAIDSYFEDENELNHPDRCFTCGSKIAFIRNPRLANTIVQTCSNKECSQRIWPAGWPEVAKPGYYAKGKPNKQGQGANHQSKARKASVARRELHLTRDKVKTINDKLDDEE